MNQEWELVVLGVAQDAGVPHIGCQGPCCAGATVRRVACVGVRNRDRSRAFLLDATPDMATQLRDLNGGLPPEGVFLTHAHIGHYTRLMYFGKEGANWRDVPVYGSASMLEFLRGNEPWRTLCEHHLSVRTIEPGQAIQLADGLEITPLWVPHRAEFTDTLGFVVRGPSQSALYVPDIDRWDTWDLSIVELANAYDYLFIDGTFASLDEIPGRDLGAVPHPPMAHSRELLKSSSGEVWFIHLNHSNPQFDAPDVARDGMVLPL